jgi:O-antigen/teichoic acid export membrane protein
MFASWFSYAANLLVMFFLTPFVIRTLGDSAYGVWTLLISLTGYMGLVELGVRPGMGRFINFYLGRNEPHNVNAIISTAMLIFLGCGVLLVVVATTLGVFFGSIFPKTPEGMLGDARLAILLIAANLFVSFYSVAFLQVLTAHERFDLSNGINLVLLGLRTVATVLALWHGGGILWLAGITLASGLVQLVAQAVLAKRIFPALRVSPRLASRAHFRELFSFGMWAAVGSMAFQLLTWFDMLMVGVFLGPAVVTLYTVGAQFVIYGRNLVGECAAPFGPQIIKDCAVNDMPGLRYLIPRAGSVIMGLSTLMFLGFVFFGREFIRLWMMDRGAGDTFETFTRFDVSYEVLMILSLAQWASTATIVLGNVYNGLNRVRFAAMLTLAQSLISAAAVVTLLLTGAHLAGVALGGAIPRVIFAIVSTMVVLRWIRFGWLAFVQTQLLRWTALAATFALICLTVNWQLPHGTLLWFAIKVGLAGLAYAPLAWFILLPRDERVRWGAMIRNKLTGR